MCADEAEAHLPEDPSSFLMLDSVQGGKLVDQTLEEFNKGIKDRVTGHFLLFKAFILYLDKQQGTFYILTLHYALLLLLLLCTLKCE